MATAMIYDTLKLAEQLEFEAGFDAARARAMARILAENAGGNLATREDLLVTKGELQTAIQAVRSDLDAKFGSLRSDLDAKFGSLRSDLDAKTGALRSDLDAKTGDLRADLDAKTGDLRADLDAKFGELDSKISALRGDVRVLYWMGGTTLAAVATLLGTAITIALHLMRLG